MSNIQATFIDLCLNGEALPTDIEEFIGRWHEGEGESKELHEYLGMNWDEYALWVEKPAALSYIIYKYDKAISLFEALERSSEYAVAARSESPAEAREILRWLKETGRIPSSPEKRG
jgi:hypothetical protein